MLKIASVVAVLLLGCLLDVLFLRTAVTRPANDYGQFYFAGQLVSRGEVAHLYEPSAYEPLAARVETENFKEHPFYYFNRPAFAALFYWPYSFFSYGAGARIFLGLNLALWGLFIWKVPQWLAAPPILRVWLVAFFPLAYAVGVGQDTIALTLLLIYSTCVLMDRNEAAAGMVLALCLVKPHLIVLMPLLLVVERKYKALLFFIGTGAALAGLSLVLVGAQGFHHWIDLLKAPTTDFSPETMGTIRALGLTFGSGAAIAAALTALGAGAYAFVRGTYRDRLAVLVILALLLSPHSYWGDYTLMALVALTTQSRIIRYTILLPWPYFVPIAMWPMVICSLGFLVLMAIQSASSSLRTAALAPLEPRSGGLEGTAKPIDRLVQAG